MTEPNRLISTARAHSAQSTSSIGPNGPYTPALLTSTCRPPSSRSGLLHESRNWAGIGRRRQPANARLAVARHARQVPPSGLELLGSRAHSMTEAPAAHKGAGDLQAEPAIAAGYQRSAARKGVINGF